MKYMLDTNVIVHLKEHMSESIIEKFKQISKTDVCISSITLAELEYGVCHSTKHEQNRMALMLILTDIEVLPFDSNAAIHYGQIREYLTKKGELIGGNDLLIAAHARANDLCLVTNNTREFQRVPELKVEDWFS